MGIKDINADFVILGAGIVGLTIALKLKEKYSNAKIVVIEKEIQTGMHASGRNSGVLHSGVYYSVESLKAKCCLSGSKQLLSYCQTHQLPYRQIGKVIVATKETDDSVLETLYSRGKQNGSAVEIVDEKQLSELEPLTRSAIGRALFVPETSVVDPQMIVKHLYESLLNNGVRFYFGEKPNQINPRNKSIKLSHIQINYMHLFNATGLYADTTAMLFGVENKYKMMPFKGLYYEVSPKANLTFNRLIYPVPDMNVPFLGVHFTTSVSGTTYVGPTAIPALGRENYHGMSGMNLKDAATMIYYSTLQYISNQDGFRNYAHSEFSRVFKSRFLTAANVLVPQVKADDLIFSKKVGIRAQLLDILNHRLITDFLIERTENETHILNAVSPAFSSSFSFAEHVIDSLSVN